MQECVSERRVNRIESHRKITCREPRMSVRQTTKENQYLDKNHTGRAVFCVCSNTILMTHKTSYFIIRFDSAWQHSKVDINSSCKTVGGMMEQQSSLCVLHYFSPSYHTSQFKLLPYYIYKKCAIEIHTPTWYKSI